MILVIVLALGPRTGGPTGSRLCDVLVLSQHNTVFDLWQLKWVLLPSSLFILSSGLQTCSDSQLDLINDLFKVTKKTTKTPSFWISWIKYRKPVCFYQGSYCTFVHWPYGGKQKFCTQCLLQITALGDSELDNIILAREKEDFWAENFPWETTYNSLLLQINKKSLFKILNYWYLN